MNLLEAMRVRRSDRSFLDTPVPPETINHLLTTFAETERLNDLRLKLLPFPAKQVDAAMTGLVGSYGKIKNAPLWMIGISQDGPQYQENFGFVTERFILECTREGLGTCWVGGYFKMSVLEKAMKKEVGERIVCITPLGYAAPRRLAARSMRAMGRLDNRRPLHEIVFHQQWGRSANDVLAGDAKLREMFEMARWAPSASNMQPWIYLLDEQRIVLALDSKRIRNYPKIIARNRAEGLNFQGVDAGIGMCHIHFAARELGLPGRWTLTGDDRQLREKYDLPPHTIVVGTFVFDQ